MALPSPASTMGVLLSGGMDSSILVAHVLDQGWTVQPLFIRGELIWEELEISAVKRFLQAVAAPALRGLVTLDLPLADLYEDHWSITGKGAPGADSPDQAVFLPGRNPLLLVKAAVWCQIHGIEYLALAALGTNPFADATDEFFQEFEAVLSRAGGRPLHILRPFGRLNKRQVTELGRDYPLELTFSCIAPVSGAHCGRCNKCSERRWAFRSAGLRDPTPYADPDGDGESYVPRDP